MRETLLSDIINEPTSYTTSKWIIERVPFIFNNDFENYIDWKERLSTLIGVDSKAIVFTGSSSVGYSLNPWKDFKEFTIESDIDVAIVSSHYFDIAWHYLRNIGTKYFRQTPTVQVAIKEHKEKYIYYGTIATDKIVHILPFGKSWVRAMSEMQTLNPTKDREINFRIYKDFESLKSYQSSGVNKLKDKILIQDNAK